MVYVVSAAGVLLLLLVAVDILATTLTLSRGGPLTNFINRLAHLVLVPWAFRSKRLRPGVGAILLATVFLSWLFLGWLGWLLIFSAEPSAIVNSTTKVGADLMDRMYFTGYTMSTLGIGDFTASSWIYQLLVGVAGGYGFAIFTLSISYLVPVVSAASDERGMAKRVAMLGSCPTDALVQSFDGQGFSPLVKRLQSLESAFASLEPKHSAYPVLRFFVGSNHGESLDLAAARLYCMAQMLRYGVREDLRPHPYELMPLMEGLKDYLFVLEDAGVKPGDETAPKPSLEPLRARGIPCVDEASWQAAPCLLEPSESALLCASLGTHGWCWDDVERGED